MSDLNAIVKAYDIRGLVPDQLDADTARGARAQLRARGLLPLSVDIIATQASGSRRTAFAPRLTDAELAWLTRQLASLLAASLPLEGALSAVIEQAERPHVAQALTAVRADVRAGQRLRFR